MFFHSILFMKIRGIIEWFIIAWITVMIVLRTYGYMLLLLSLVLVLIIFFIIYLLKEYSYAKTESKVKDNYILGSESSLHNFSKNAVDSDADKYLKMGLEFEKYSLALFPESEWDIVDISKDQIGKTKRKIESQKNPDMILRNIQSGKSFIIECKYRSKFRKGIKSEVVKWAEDYQMKNYALFQKEKNLPFYVILGIEGVPSSPKQLFLIPFKEIRYKWLSKDYLKQYLHQTNKPFTVDGAGHLK